MHSVLIVDDATENIDILKEVLRGEYSVKAATNGQMALKIAKMTHPDIILLDIMMPEMDGYEVCRRLKNEPETKDIPIIFVTARSDSEDEAKGLVLGAVDYISKPFNNAVVKARVNTHVQLKIRTDQLEQLAMVDGLTGIANRRSFDRTLDLEWKRAARDGRNVSVIMMDIDHFKAYNDNYGHGAGDICLQRVAAALRSAIHRPADLIARYGGEEFVALLPETEAEGAAGMAEACRRAVFDQALPHAFSPVAGQVTITAGHATRTALPEQTFHDLLEAADKALFQAKQAGRNQVLGEAAASRAN